MSIMKNCIKIKTRLEMRLIENAVLLPRDIDGYPLGIYEDRRHIERSGKRIYATDCFRTTEKKLSNEMLSKAKKNMMYVPSIYVGYIRTHWGHFMVDGMSKLWWSNYDNFSESQ